MSKDGSGNLLGPSLTLDIDCILNSFEEDERMQEKTQITFVLLRNISGLRRIYGFYSSLGHDKSPSNAYVMTKFQFWRFLKDCHLHYHNTSLSAIDRIIAKTHSSEEVHSPMEKIIFRQFLSYCVIIAFNFYKKEHESDEKQSGLAAKCLQLLFDEHVLKLSGRVGGHFLMEPRRAINALAYMERSWRIYQKVRTERRQSPFELSLYMRQFLFLLKDLQIIGPKLTTRDVLRILAADDPCVFDGENCNLELEMTFLEFFEALTGIALSNNTTVEKSHQHSLQTERVSPRVTKGKFQTSDKNVEKRETETTQISSHFIKTSPEDEFNIWCSKLHKFFTQLFFPAWQQAETLRNEVERNKAGETTDSEAKTFENAKPRREQTYHLVPRREHVLTSPTIDSISGSDFDNQSSVTGLSRASSSVGSAWTSASKSEIN